MNRIFLPLLCAVLGLATASCGQSQGPFGATESAGTPAGAAAAAMASPPDSPVGSPPAASQPGAQAGADQGSAPTEHRASTLIDMPVVSADDSPLGEVKDIIFDSQGRATHVVIACEEPSTAAASSPDGKLVALPWETAIARITGGRLVLDNSHLQGAPSFTPEAWPNLDDPAWSVTADAYWRKVVHPPAAVHRGNPVDSTARQRARRTRDGDGDGD
jgi:sporulation protein YlmC with PRC-barrel domain